MVPPAFLEIFPFLRVKTSLRGQMVQFVNTEFVARASRGVLRDCVTALSLLPSPTLSLAS